MKHLRRLLAVAAAAFFIAGSALAQNAGTVTSHAFAIGKGPGTTGFASLLCTSAQLAVGQAAADPICRSITGDVTITAAGVTAIGAATVHSSMLNADVFSTAHSWSATQTLTNPIIAGASPNNSGQLGYSAGFINWYDGTAIRTVVGADATQTLTNKTFNCASNTCTVRLGSDVTGTLLAASFPALTGDVTTSAGSLATTLANIPTAVPAAGSIIHSNIAAPASPAAGKVSIWTDSTDLRLHDKNASGVIGTTVVADTGAANNFLTAISAAGAISKARPACASISDAGVFCNGTSAASLTGTQATATVPAFAGGDVTSPGGSLVLSIGATKVTSATLNADVFSTAHSWGGVQTLASPIFTGVTDIQGAQKNSTQSAPAQITADQNNYNPSSVVCSSSATLLINSDAARNITGIAGAVAGCDLFLVNNGSFTITLKEENASSIAGNRFTFGGDFALAAKSAAHLKYDGGSSRWRNTTGSAAGGSGTVTQVICNGGTTTITISGTCASREVLAGNRTYFVGANIGSVTISIATPAVATHIAHGLSANDPVVFQVPPNKTTATISAANPGVVTMTNTFAAGQPVVFASTGTLPANIVQGTTYYVIATGLSGASFQISATVGGAAINTTALTNTFTNGSTTVTTSAAHNLVVGQIINFAGTSVVNVSNATNYYVLSVPTGTTFTFAATGGGAAITPGVVTTQGTFVQAGTHTVSSTGLLPTGVTEGTTYYVLATGLTADAFQFAATPGGAAINTTGTVTGSPVYSCYTGNDSNNGLAQTRAGAFLTVQKALTAAGALDLATFAVTIQMADGTFTAATNLSTPFVGGSVTLQGNTTNVGNVQIVTTSVDALTVTSYAVLNIKGLKFKTITSGSAINVTTGGTVNLVGAMEFGAVAFHHMIASSQGIITIQANYAISGGALAHIVSQQHSFITAVNLAITITNVPAWNGSYSFAVASDASAVTYYGHTISGSATGPRYLLTTNGVVNANGGGANFLPGTAAGTASTGGQYG